MLCDAESREYSTQAEIVDLGGQAFDSQPSCSVFLPNPRRQFIKFLAVMHLHSGCIGTFTWGGQAFDSSILRCVNFWGADRARIEESKA